VVQVISFETALPMAVYTFRYHDDRSILPIPGDPLGRKMYLDPKVPQRSTILEIAYPPQPRRP
jgi:hypothetical protein